MKSKEFYKSTAWKWFSKFILLYHSKDGICICASCGARKSANDSKMHLGQAKIVEKHIEDMKDTPFKKQKGGGTTKTCLPASKIRSMSKEERQKLVNSKKAAGAKGKYKRSSKTNVKGARKPGATLRDWFEKEDWRRVDDPSKKCGE